MIKQNYHIYNIFYSTV